MVAKTSDDRGPTVTWNDRVGEADEVFLELRCLGGPLPIVNVVLNYGVCRLDEKMCTGAVTSERRLS